MAKTWIMGDIQLDEKDKYLLEKYKFWLKDGLYPQTKIDGKNTYIYHLILNTNELVDHIDRNPLNNKRNNLRIATKSTNAMNSKLRSDNSSGIKGISWRKEKNSWETYININKKRIRLGYFKDIKEAALKRIEAEKIYFGEFANLELIKKVEEKYA